MKDWCQGAVTTYTFKKQGGGEGGKVRTYIVLILSFVLASYEGNHISPTVGKSLHGDVYLRKLVCKVDSNKGGFENHQQYLLTFANQVKYSSDFENRGNGSSRFTRFIGISYT